MSTTVPVRRDVRALPKAHLHVHLEAALPSAVAEAIARAEGKHVDLPFAYADFGAFADDFFALVALVGRPEMIDGVLDAVAADAVHDGVLSVELSVLVGWLPDAFGSLRVGLERITVAAATAAARHGVRIGIMPTIDRAAPVEAGLDAARTAAEFAGRGVVSFGLAGEERGHPAAPFVGAADIARAAGLKITPHAGELADAASLRETIDSIAPDRILHGIRAVDDPDLLEDIVRAGIALDVCPTSNVVLGAVASMRTHPLRTLLANDVRCSINADDPTLFGVGIADEYENARVQLGLSDRELASCARTSVLEAHLTAPERVAALAAIDDWLR